MNDPKLTEVEGLFAKEIAELRGIAVYSSDPLVIAKAIAVSDKGVQQVILDRLTKGESLTEVFVLQGTSHSELQVFFRFLPAKQIAPLVDTGILVAVDSVKGLVIGTVDPFILQPERRVGRPFVAVSAHKSTGDATGHHSQDSMVERERAFFNNLGLEQFARARVGLTTDTVCNTDVASTTYQPTGPGGRYAPEDTGRETCGDYCDSSGPILA